MHISSTSDFTVVYEPKSLQEYMLIKLSEWIDERAKFAAQEIHKTPTRKKDIDEPNKREPASYSISPLNITSFFRTICLESLKKGKLAVLPKKILWLNQNPSGINLQ